MKTETDWPKIREMILHRDGRCLCCGAVMGLAPHHIKSRGSGGTDLETNIVTLCAFCHNAVHRGYIVPGRRIERSKAQRLKVPVYEGERMREYLSWLVEERYG